MPLGVKKFLIKYKKIWNKLLVLALIPDGIKPFVCLIN